MDLMVVEERSDYFSDRSILIDPYQYFEEMRAHGPVVKFASRDIVMVTGFNESVEILLNSDDFSSAITAEGPVADLPFEIGGEDISEQIEAHRLEISPTDLVVTYDDRRHSETRALIMGLFTPSRLKANEQYMTGVADRMIDEIVARGGCEVIKDVAAPFVTLVIADLLGVPDEDRETFRDIIDAGPPAGNVDHDDERPSGSTLFNLAPFFAAYVADRRANPRNDVLTELSTAAFSDGRVPDAAEIVKLAMFLFAAGQDTSAKLLGNAIRRLAEDPELQRMLRADPSLLAGFIDEVLRLEGSTKATFRVARRATRIGGVDVPAGARVVISLAAANRDPRRWDNPEEFRIGRAKIKEHLAFGRGRHVCAGAPLARVEVRVFLERLFQRTSDILLSEEHHGPPGNRSLSYEPSYIIRGLETLHVRFVPA